MEIPNGWVPGVDVDANDVRHAELLEKDIGLYLVIFISTETDNADEGVSSSCWSL